MKTVKIKNVHNRLQSVECTEGETIEQKVERIVQNQEPITDGAPIIFTERKDGVLPAYNIRTDRFDIAIEAMDKYYAANAAKSKNPAEKPNVTDVPDKIEGGSPTEN